MKAYGQGDQPRILMERLLEANFPGSAELRMQLAKAAIRKVVSQGAPAYLFTIDPGAPRSPVKQRVPLEAQALDQDGVQIHLLVHVRNGILSELELHREDGEPILRLPSPEGLSVTVIG